MVNLIAFDTEKELCELTGLTESELWEKGFILDDWDIGFQSDIKLHRTPTADDIQDGYEEDELIDDYDLPAHATDARNYNEAEKLCLEQIKKEDGRFYRNIPEDWNNILFDVYVQSGIDHSYYYEGYMIYKAENL